MQSKAKLNLKLRNDNYYLISTNVRNNISHVHFSFQSILRKNIQAIRIISADIISRMYTCFLYTWEFTLRCVTFFAFFALIFTKLLSRNFIFIFLTLSFSLFLKRNFDQYEYIVSLFSSSWRISLRRRSSTPLRARLRRTVNKNTWLLDITWK